MRCTGKLLMIAIMVWIFAIWFSNWAGLTVGVVHEYYMHAVMKKQKVEYTVVCDSTSTTNQKYIDLGKNPLIEFFTDLSEIYPECSLRVDNKTFDHPLVRNPIIN